MAGVNMDSDDNDIWGSNQSIETASPGMGLTNVSRITTHTPENTIPGRDGDEQMPALLSDSESGVNMDSDDNDICGQSIEVASPGTALTNVSRITIHTPENTTRGRDVDEQSDSESGVNMDSDDNDICGQSVEVASPGTGLTNVSRITIHTPENTTRGRDGDEQSDSESDDEATWNNLGGYSSGSSDTSDGDYLFNGNLSDASDDSSIADDDDDYGVFEMLSNHFDVFNNFVPAFFGVSLQMLYARIMENITLDEERESPTPQHILDLLPSTKVTVAQVASNLSCCICFCDYVLNEELLQLPCSHIYHRNCILDWLKIKCTCPTCRLDLTTNISDTNETNDLSDFNTENSSTENLVYNMDRDTIYDSIDNFSSQQLSSNNLTVSVDNISELPTMASPNLTLNSNSNSNHSLSTTGNDFRTSSQNTLNISHSSTVTHFGTTNTGTSEGPSNSSTVEMVNTDKSAEAVQPNITSNVKGTKRFSRETEIW